MSRRVLVASSGFIHPSLACRFWLQRWLACLQGYHFQRIPSLERVSSDALQEMDALLLYFHHTSISQEALERLERYVQNGGGIFALHAASASFKEETRYHSILGGWFVEHGPIEVFEVRPLAENDEVFGAISPFSVRDELYRHEYHPENRIHFYTEVNGEKEPVVWTRQHGKGRVCYCSLGHTPEAMRSSSVHQILQRGLGWVTTVRQ